MEEYKVGIEFISVNGKLLDSMKALSERFSFLNKDLLKMNEMLEISSKLGFSSFDSMSKGLGATIDKTAMLTKELSEVKRISESIKFNTGGFGGGSHGNSLKSRFHDQMSMGFDGMFMGGMGLAGFHALTKPINAAAEYQGQMARLTAQGVNGATLKMADHFARTSNVIGASYSDSLKMFADANSVLRDASEAQAVTPLLLKMKYGIESVMMSRGEGAGHGDEAEKIFMSALKVGELRGALVDPLTQKFDISRFSKVMDFMTRSYTASNGLVKPQDFLAFIKTGGIAAKMLSDKAFYNESLHGIQEMGGNRYGTGLMSAFQNMYMGRTTQQVAEEMDKLGLLNRKDLHYGKTGHITKIDPGALAQAELFRTSQFEYMNQFLIPLEHSKGVKDGLDMQLAIAKLFSNRVGGSNWVSMYMERSNIQKHADAAANALGVKDLSALGYSTLQGKELAYQANLSKLYQDLGETILPLTVKGLDNLCGALKDVDDMAKRHPTLTKFALEGIAVASSIAVIGGSALIVGAGFKGLNMIMLGLPATMIKNSYAAGVYSKTLKLAEGTYLKAEAAALKYGDAIGMRSIGGAAGIKGVGLALAGAAGDLMLLYQSAKLISDYDSDHRDYISRTILPFAAAFGDQDAVDLMNKGKGIGPLQAIWDSAGNANIWKYNTFDRKDGDPVIKSIEWQRSHPKQEVHHHHIYLDSKKIAEHVTKRIVKSVNGAQTGYSGHDGSMGMQTVNSVG